jgi:hypothetical protein
MIVHIVLFRPRADLDDGARHALVAAIQDAASGAASVRQFTVGRRLATGPAYLAPPQGDFPYAAIVTFDDREGLDAYLRDPVHLELSRVFNASLEAAVIVDYDAYDARGPLHTFDDVAVPPEG